MTYRHELTRRATPATVNAVMRVLSACLSTAVEEGLIPANPCRGIRPIPSPPADRRPIPLEVVDALLERTEGRDRLIVALLCYAGLRPGEVRALRWQDVGSDALYVGRSAGQRGVKSTKTGGVRAVPLRPELAAALADARAFSHASERGGALVAPGARGGLLSWHNWLSRVWRPARDASLLIAEGRSVVEVAAWMGHASATTTLRHYAHLFALRDEPGRGATSPGPA
jgi:integrase